MNKKRIDSYIDRAVDALKDSGIAQGGKIKKGYRGQISTFGAAVTNGSLKAAIAFFSNDVNSSDSDRPLLMKSICYILNLKTDKKADDYESTDLYYSIEGKNGKAASREEILDAAIALKLAMNFFVLEE